MFPTILSRRVSRPRRACSRGQRRVLSIVSKCSHFQVLAFPSARTIVNAHHVSQACMQSSCAHHVPHCTVQALRARGKRAVVLPHAFGLLSRSQRLWQGAGAVHRQHLSLHVDGVAPAASVQPRQACSRLTSRFWVAFAFSTICGVQLSCEHSEYSNHCPAASVQCPGALCPWQDFWRSHAPRGASGRWLVGPFARATSSTSFFI